jgi:hypothetical protein
VNVTKIQARGALSNHNPAWSRSYPPSDRNFLEKRELGSEKVVLIHGARDGTRLFPGGAALGRCAAPFFTIGRKFSFVSPLQPKLRSTLHRKAPSEASGSREGRRCAAIQKTWEHFRRASGSVSQPRVPSRWGYGAPHAGLAVLYIERARLNAAFWSDSRRRLRRRFTENSSSVRLRQRLALQRRYDPWRTGVAHPSDESVRYCSDQPGQRHRSIAGECLDSVPGRH